MVNPLCVELDAHSEADRDPRVVRMRRVADTGDVRQLAILVRVFRIVAAGSRFSHGRPLSLIGSPALVGLGGVLGSARIVLIALVSVF